MATLSDIFTPVMKGLFKSYKSLDLTQLQEIAWLMSLYVTGINSQSDLNCKTEAGFQAAIELFEGNPKVDFITYESPRNVRSSGGYNYSSFQFGGKERDVKYEIIIEHRWSYFDEGVLIEEFDHDYYSLDDWRERVLRTFTH